MSEKELLFKIISMREYLLSTGKGLKNEALVKKALTPFKRWISFYGKKRIADNGCKVMMLKHWDSLMILLPGKESTAYDTLLNHCLKLKL